MLLKVVTPHDTHPQLALFDAAVNGCGRRERAEDLAAASVTSFPEVPLPPRPWLEVPPSQREVRVRVGRRKQTVQLPARLRSPLVLNYGMGTDSTALIVLLVEMHRRGHADARPDCILFANTGSEKPETLAYLPTINAYLEAAGCPQVTVVSKAARGLKASRDGSLHAACLRLHTMPSLAYGGKSCSLKWKAAEMDLFLNSWEPAVLARAAGLPVMKLIGYDASPADLRRSRVEGDERQRFHYPLRDARLTRPYLKGIIRLAGLPQPGKSACFLCPASKRSEVSWLAEHHPELARIALEVESRALSRTRAEGRSSSTVGLGRNWNWAEFLGSVDAAGGQGW